MAWWRSRRRGGAGLALLALAVQIVLSFGHLHLQDLQPGLAAATAYAEPFDRAPAHRQGPGVPDNGCPICIAMHLTASGVVSVPPAVVVPSEYNRIAHQTSAMRRFSPARYVLFRTRAPPAA
jgi:hypothetical protein